MVLRLLIGSWFLSCPTLCLAHLSEPLQVYTEHFAPYQIVHPSGNVGGVATQKVKALIKMAHLSANIHVLPWYRSQQIVEQTPNTLIYSLVRTPERESQFIWLLPLCRLDISFYRLKSRTDIHINTLSDARRYVVAVASGQPSEAFLRQHDFSSEDNLVPLTSLEQSAGMMEKSRVDLVFGASQFLENLVSQNQAKNEWIKVLTVNELSKQTYLAANKDSRGDVLNALQAAVKLFVESEPNDTECSTTEQP